MRVRVLAFARVADVLGWHHRDLQMPAGATTADLWTAAAGAAADTLPLAGSTRIARNGRVVMHDEALEDGDELALLPPVSGG